MLDRLDDLVLGLDDISEFQRLAGRHPVEDLDQNGMRRIDATVQRLAAIGFVIAFGVRKRGADPLQDALRVERPRDRIGGAERPGLHRPVVKRVASTNSRGISR